MRNQPDEASKTLAPAMPAPSDFDLASAWAESKYRPAVVLRMCRAIYKGLSIARKEFPDVDWISLLAILDAIAVARAEKHRVDVSYIAFELCWPRTSALRRLRRYERAGYLTLTRQGRHTYVDSTPEGRRRALVAVDSLIDALDGRLVSDMVNLEIV